jgi:hypothetical protein
MHETRGLGLPLIWCISIMSLDGVQITSFLLFLWATIQDIRSGRFKGVARVLLIAGLVSSLLGIVLAFSDHENENLPTDSFNERFQQKVRQSQSSGCIALGVLQPLPDS